MAGAAGGVGVGAGQGGDTPMAGQTGAAGQAQAGAGGDAETASGGTAGSFEIGGAGGSMAVMPDAGAPPDAQPAAMLPRERVFLMIGQSNMAGMAAIESADLQAVPRTNRLTYNKQWRSGAEPWAVNQYNASSNGQAGSRSMGPSRAFAVAMMEGERDPMVNLWIVNAAVSGSNIESWATTDASNYRYMVSFLDEALKKGKLVGIVWHQGEANGGTQPAAYAEMLQRLIKNIRDHVGDQTVPVVAGQVGISGSANANVNRALELLASRDARFAWASSAGLSLIDNVHYDGRSQRLMGQRYAERMKALLGR